MTQPLNDKSEIVAFLESMIRDMEDFEANRPQVEVKSDKDVWKAHREGWLNAHREILKAIERGTGVLPALTEEERQDRVFRELDRAILDYQAQHDPDSEVRSWMVLTDKYNLVEGAPIIGNVPSAGMSWATQRGILEIALDREKNDLLKWAIVQELKKGEGDATE